MTQWHQCHLETRKQKLRNTSILFKIIGKFVASTFNTTMNVKKTTSKTKIPAKTGGYDVKLNPALTTQKELELNEEWANFMTKVGQVSTLVKDMASGDKARADAAEKLADSYLEGKAIVDENVEMQVKDNRTVINHAAFKSIESANTGEMDKEVWMAEMSKDADRRHHDRKIRKEKSDTLKTLAMKAFRREEYEKALSCYNKAIEHLRDSAMLYCDRALTNIKLKNYEKVIPDCDLALRLNENSYKARLYKAKAYKELEETDKYQESREDLKKTFAEHEDLSTFFLEKKDREYELEEVPESESDSD